MAELWYDSDLPPLPEIELLKTGRLRHGATVFDLGAHQGVVAMILAKEVGPAGKVIAVEATPHNADAAKTNVLLNSLDQIEVLNMAAAANDGVVRFADSLNGHVGDVGDPFPTVPVRAVTVDSLARSHGSPDVVFIDVEGFEEQVLRGATETLERHPDWFVEVHSGWRLENQHGSVGSIVHSFKSRGYRLFAATEGQQFVELADPPAGRFYLIARAP